MSFSHLAKNITCHAWNGDGTKVALCPNNNEILVYAYTAANNSFKLEQTLREHDQLVSSIDWHPVTKQLVSCSHDRNAYVWTPDARTGVFTPSLCILQINRAATCVKWSPQGNKFAVGSGAKHKDGDEKVVSVCHFEAENNWWVPKQFPAHDSTILALAWHPNNLVLATASSDNKCRIYSAYHRECDGKLKQPKLGEKLAEFTISSGWVHSVDWSPTGSSLGFVSHDSSVYIADLVNTDGEGKPTVHTVRCGDLPFTSVMFLSEQALIATGHSSNPTLFTFEGGRWARKSLIDKKGGGAAANAAARPGASSDFTRAAFARFQTAAAPVSSSSSGGASGSGSGGAAKSADTIHTNPITEVRALGKQEGTVTKVSTIGLDGKIVVWNLPTLGIEELTRALAL